MLVCSFNLTMEMLVSLESLGFILEGLSTSKEILDVPALLLLLLSVDAEEPLVLLGLDL